MPRDHILDRIESELNKYANFGVRSVPGRAMLICPLGQGELSALHVLFAPLDESGFPKLRNTIPFPLPDDYIHLMQRWNGMRLYDNILFVYGVLRKLSRSPRLEDISPVGLDPELLEIEYRECGFVPIGSVAAARTAYDLQLSASGLARLKAPDGRVRLFDSVGDMIFTLIVLFAPLANEHGLLDDTAETLEREVEAFIQSS